MNMNLIRQAQKLQAGIAKAQEELETVTLQASAGGGAVNAVVTGGLKLQSIHIDPEVVDPSDIEMLQDLVVAAVNEGLEEAQKLAQRKMGALTGGMKLPGIG
jgi:DNA-binding YbaB/EbfC family protein